MSARNGHTHAAGRERHASEVSALIVDDCKLHRENLAAIFAVNGIAAPVVAWDLGSLSASLCEGAPDVVLMNMSTRDSVMLLHRIREKCPQVKVIAVGMSDDDEATIVTCAEAGVAGYHLRNESLDHLVEMISEVLEGEPSYPSSVCTILMKRLSVLAAQRQPVATELVLTARETQILRMLEMGLSNREIADRLCIALHTVKNHVHSVLGKLGVSTRCEAAAYVRSRQHQDPSIEGLGTGRL